MTTTTKKCCGCKIVKPISDFHKSNTERLGVTHYCKACVAVYAKKRYSDTRSVQLQRSKLWYQNNKIRALARSRKWAEANPDLTKAARARFDEKNPHAKRDSWKRWAEKNADYLKHRRTDPRFKLRSRLNAYGLSEDAYNKLVKAQNGKCAVCNKQPKILTIDHCHTTGVVRGLLCGLCNSAIGHMKDDPQRMRSAALYLERSTAK